VPSMFYLKAFRQLNEVGGEISSNALKNYFKHFT
jgi:hypothetical protein